VRRPIDTRELGPIRVPLPGDRGPRERARDAFADSVAARGPGWRNAAESIRAGWENVWVQAGIDALAAAFRLIPEDGA
jgi:hypothetical protein